MWKAKYIKTKENRIIVFSASLEHAKFSSFNPISAGFISIGVGKDGNPDCICHGESASLGLKSDKNDTQLAKLHILGQDY